MSKVAVVVTTSDNEPSVTQFAKWLGFDVTTPRTPTIASIVRTVPDLVLIDWSPGSNSVQANTELVGRLRTTATTKDVPIVVAYSDEKDLPEEIWSVERLAPLRIPFAREAFERAVRRISPNDLTTPQAPDRRKPVREVLAIQVRESKQADLGGIIVSARQTSSERADLVIGCPGLPNLQDTLSVGGAVLFETPDGLFEIRVLKTLSQEVEVLISHVSPRPGVTAGFVDQDQENVPFTREEAAQIATSLDRIKRAMSERADVTAEQFAFLTRKLADIHAASERLGRKDWINYALGTLTSVVVSAAFEPSARQVLFQTAQAALSWIFASGIKLLE
jgi:hypothetical protein